MRRHQPLTDRWHIRTGAFAADTQHRVTVHTIHAFVEFRSIDSRIQRGVMNLTREANHVEPFLLKPEPPPNRIETGPERVREALSNNHIPGRIGWFERSPTQQRN